jgi:predicted nucleotidyltransferase/alkylated DNA nucleotide flippase Atl1
MRLTHPLDDLFRTRSHVRILRALDELPEGYAASAREIARRAGVSHPTASAVLASLSEQGLVAIQRVPRADLFEFDRSHVLVERLRDLYAWERELPDALISFLSKELGKKETIAAAFLFGSAARGDMEPSSDLDLAIVARARDARHIEEAVSQLGETVRKKFGNRLNVIIGTGSLRALRSGGKSPGLWRAVIREGIPLVAERRGSAAHA